MPRHSAPSDARMRPFIGPLILSPNHGVRSSDASTLSSARLNRLRAGSLKL